MKKVIFTILFVIATLSLTAQTVTIGTGTFTSIYPFASYRMDARTQILYTAAELTASGAYAGNITSIDFKFSSAPSTQVLNGFLIRMKNTSASSLTAFDNNGLNQCLSTSYTPPAIGWQTINLTSPFSWNGTSNVLIDVAYDNETSSSNSVIYASYNPGKTWAETGHSSGQNLYSNTYGTTQNYRPNIQLHFDPTPMSYSSSTCTQPSTDVLPIGSSGNSVLLLNVVITGSVSPLTLTQLNLSTNGSTSPADITAAKVYYTGSSNTLSTNAQFGSTVTNPVGAYYVSGTQNLIYGNNYFWVLYDISTYAVPEDLIDAECTQITVSGSNFIPSITAPAGNRAIKAPFIGTYTINSAGSGNRNFTDFRSAVNELNIVGLSGPVTFDVAADQIFNYTVAASTNPAIVTPYLFGIIITVTGTADNPIIFRKTGNGANPVLNFTGSDVSYDIGLLLVGSDYITFDGIDVHDIGTSDANCLYYGFYINGSNTNYCNNITIKNCTVDLTKNNGVSIGICTTYSSYCHFYSNTILDAKVGYICNYGVSNELGTNTITNIANTALYMSNQTDLKILNNTIINVVLADYASSGSICGMEIQNSTAEVSNNTISGVGVIAGSSTASVYGIISRNNTFINIHDNTINDLFCNFYNLQGIFVSGGNTINIYKNKIFGLVHSGFGSRSVQGISIQGSTTNNIYNNYIYDLKAPNASSNHEIPSEYFTYNAVGIYLFSGITNNIYNNTVLLNYAPTGINPNFSAALYSTANSTTIDLRNNIFVNMVDLSGNSSPYSKAVATSRNNTGFSNYSPNSNNNLYYAGIPGAKHYICNNGTICDTTLAQYKAHIATKDQNSFTEIPPFINTSTLPYDLHLSSSIPTRIEAEGNPVTTPFAVIDDYYGTLRNTTTPDVGAEEGDFIDIDNSAMSFASATCIQPSTEFVLVNSLNNNVLLVNVVTTGSTNPLVLNQFRLSTNGSTSDSDISAAKIYYTGDSNIFADDFQFGSVFPNPNGIFSITGSQMLNYGNNYFWVVYNVSASAVAGHFVDAECSQITVAGNLFIPSVTAPAGIREIKDRLSGVYTINSNGSGERNYPDFASAVNELNLLGISGPVTYDVTAGQIFNYTIAPAPNNYGLKIMVNSSADNPVTFRKSGTGANPALHFIGTSHARDIAVYLCSSNYLTFDGIDIYDAGTSDDNFLDLGYYLGGIDNCSHITIQNCAVDLTKTNINSIAVSIESLYTQEAGAGSNYNFFYNNTIRNAYYGYSFSGSSLNPDIGNEIGTSGGISTISNISCSAINMVYQTSLRIFNNTISDVSPCYEGAVWVLSGIYCVSGSADIFNNTITGLSNTTYKTHGIYATSNSIINIYGNDLNSFTSSNMTVQGITVDHCTTANIYKNRISNIASTGIISIVLGISIFDGTTSNIYNNYIYDLRTPVSTISRVAASGIHILAGGTSNIFNNTVYLNYASTGSGMNSSAAITFMNYPAIINMINNIFVNMVDLSANSSPASQAMVLYGYLINAGNYSTTTNNNLYYAGTPGNRHYIYVSKTYMDTLYILTLEQFKAGYPAKDQNSVTELPPFINTSTLPYDLHLSTTIPTQIENGGTPITSPFALTDDFYGTPRNATTPDIGAEEIEYTIPAPLLNITLNGDGNIQLSWIPVPGANSYKIYASNTPYNIVQLANQLSTQSGTQYLDSTPGTKKFYTVVASTDAVTRSNTPILKNTTKTMKGN